VFHLPEQSVVRRTPARTAPTITPDESGILVPHVAIAAGRDGPSIIVVNVSAGA
jgi:hypothetical protein